MNASHQYNIVSVRVNIIGQSVCGSRDTTKELNASHHSSHTYNNIVKERVNIMGQCECGSHDNEGMLLLTHCH